MNLTKKTLFWVIVLIALSGAFYFFDKEAEETRLAKEASLRLFPFSAQQVSDFWVRSADETLPMIRAARDAEGWRLTEPLSVKGDDEAINQFLTNIVTGRRDAVLFEQPEPEKLAELGLDKPEVELGLGMNGEEIVILFGHKGPTLNVSYIMLKGSPVVYRVHSDLKKETSKDVYAFRDKTILDLDPVNLRRLEIEQKAASRIVVEHRKGKWTMLEPTQGLASMAKVLETLYEIDNGQVKAFVDEKPFDLASYGLSYPLLKLTIYEAEQNTPQVLLIGSKDRERRGYFAKTQRGENVFDVEEDLVNAILSNIDKLSEAEAGPAS